MNYIRIICTVAFGTLAAFTIVAVDASAESLLCTKDANHQNGEACTGTHGYHLAGNALLSAQLIPGTKLLLTTTNASGGIARTLECSKSAIGGTVVNGTAGSGNVESLTITECSSSGCTNVSMKTPAMGKSNVWPFSLTTTSPGESDTNGIVDVEHVSIVFTATCLFITAGCEWEASSAAFHLAGGAPATLRIESMPLTKLAGAEAFCGSKADLNMRYQVSTPNSLFVL